jgi:hypothetical protein
MLNPPPPLLSPPFSTDSDKLRYHLALYGFVEEPVLADGNCQFHALVHQLTVNCVQGSDKLTAESLREKSVKWLSDNKDSEMDAEDAPGKSGKLSEKIEIHNVGSELESVDANMNFEQYIEYMKTDKTWGDDITLLAVAALYKVEIVVFSSVSENFIIIIRPPEHWNITLSKRIFVGHAINHYVSAIYRPSA